MRPLTCALLLLSLACADPRPSRVVAIVDAESLVRESTREVVVSVWGGESTPPSEDGVPLEETFVMRRAPGDGGFDWPLRILLRPRDGRDRTYRIRVRAFDAASGAGAFVAETRAVNRYARGEVRELRLLLIDDCIGQMCAQNERCIARGLCEELGEDPLLPPEDAGMPTDDGGAPECTRNADCDDGNPCTDDSCVDGSCERANNTATCDDGRFCTSGDVCMGGACVGGADPCAGLTCDEASDRCTGCTDTCPDVVGEWSTCSFADECAFVMGTQERTVSPSVCMAGECVPSGMSRVDTQSCTRSTTDGRSCGDSSEILGPCVPRTGSCGTQLGDQTVTIVTPVCGGGTCGETRDTRMQTCTATVPCSDAGVDAGFDAGRDAGMDARVPEAGPGDGGDCPCMLLECEGRACPNGGSCGMQQCENGEFDCSDGADDDLDTLIDCDDPDCLCEDAGTGGPELCDNGSDDDGDGDVDCADFDCTGEPCSGCGFATCLCVGISCEGGPAIADGGVM